MASDFLTRLEALEARQLALADLPLAALQRKLEQDWLPEADVLLGDASITPAMLTGVDFADLPLRVGTGTCVFTASTLSSAVTITHGLGRVPQFIVTQSLDRAAKVSPAVGATLTDFSASGKYDTSVTGNVFFYWMVI